MTLLKKRMKERKKKKKEKTIEITNFHELKKRKEKYCTIKLAITISVLKLKIIRCMRYDV